MPQSAVYLIAQGDTLTSIARHYNPAADARQLQQAIDQIAATNRLANPDRIRAGQVLEIEVDAPAGRKAPGPTLVSHKAFRTSSSHPQRSRRRLTARPRLPSRFPGNWTARRRSKSS